MKTSYQICIAWLLATLLTVSCEIPFLEEKAQSFIEKKDFYKTDADFEAGLYGIYDMLGSSTMLTTPSTLTYTLGGYSYGYTLLGDCGTDLFRLMNTAQTDIIPLETYNIQPSANVCLVYWTGQYILINRANALIDRVTEAETSTFRKQCKAEAVFLRTLAYFNLVRVYGGVPLVMQDIPSGTYLTPIRTTIQEVLEANIQALEAVLDNLPATTTSSGRVGKNAAQALLAKIYLHMASMKNLAELSDEVKLNGINSFDFVNIEEAYAKARDYAKNVLTSISSGNPLFKIEGGETIPVEYADNYYPVEKSQDLIFDAQFSSNFAIVEGSWVYRAFGPQGTATDGGGGNFLRPLWKNHFKTYDTNDKRLKVNIATWRLVTVNGDLIEQEGNANQTKTWMSFIKFRTMVKPTHANNNGPNNMPILRVAEVALMYAEALAELAALTGSSIPDEAYLYLNYVRERARDTTDALPDIEQSTLSDLTVVKPLVEGQNILPGGVASEIAYFRIALLNERKWELCGEGNRIYDLVRMGVWYDMVKALDTVENETNAQLVHKRVNVQKFHCFRPIPQRERDLYSDQLIQNYGY